jgi:hypothetical protein
MASSICNAKKGGVMVKNFGWTAMLLGLSIFVGSDGKAAVYTFDTSTDLTDNFNIDVVAGDFGTQWQSGYGSSGGYPASDGGFVLSNWYDSSNSIQFASGPVLLNSFDISSQYSSGGWGVFEAERAANDYHLKLFDEFFNPLFDEILTVAEGGVWETLYFDLANVSTIWLAQRDDDGTGTGGWWPNLDNIVVNEAVQAVPVPAALPLLATALGSLWYFGRRRRRDEGTAHP